MAVVYFVNALGLHFFLIYPPISLILFLESTESFNLLAVIIYSELEFYIYIFRDFSILLLQCLGVINDLKSLPSELVLLIHFFYDFLKLLNCSLPRVFSTYCLWSWCTCSFLIDDILSLFFFCSGMGPDFRVLVRKSRKQAEQYYRLYKVNDTMKLFLILIF